MKKFSILTFIVLTVMLIRVQAQDKYETIAAKRNATIKNLSAQKMKDHFSLMSPARKQALVYLPQVEVQDAWNHINQTWDSTTRIQNTYDTEGNISTMILTDVIYGPFLKYDFMYTPERQVTLMTVQSYDMQKNDWVNSSRTANTYDSEGRKVMEFVELWDTTMNHWMSNTREQTQFDSHGLETKYTFELYENGVWNIMEGIEMPRFYDNNGYLIEDIAIHYIGLTQRWDTIDRVLYTNSPNGTIQQTIYQLYDHQAGWINSQKEVFTLNANEVVEASLRLQYDSQHNDWDSVVRMINIVWASWVGQVEGSEYQSFVVQTRMFGVFENLNYFHSQKPDNYGSYIHINEAWNGINWVPVDRMTGVFDMHSNFKEFTYEEFHDTAYVTTSYNKQDITYGTHDEILEIALSEMDFNGGMINTYRYRFSNFLPFNLGVKRPELNSSAIHIYPNPSGSVSNISLNVNAKTLTSIEVYNMLGEKVAVITQDQLIEQGTNRFEFHAPASGVYIIKTQLNDKAYANKLIVK